MWWLFVMGCYVQATQGNVTREQLGHLGGNPHFTPPPYDPINAIEHGIAPDWARYERERER